MPLSYAMDVDRRIVVFVADGVLSAADMRDVQARIREDPLFDPAWSSLFDMREVTSVALTSEDLFGVARSTPFKPGNRRAMVVASKIQFGMSRMYQAFIDAGIETYQIFEHREEALRWLAATDAARGE